MVRASFSGFSRRNAFFTDGKRRMASGEAERVSPEADGTEFRRLAS
jgi:hypothetical protein